jgi:hypothetical protein
LSAKRVLVLVRHPHERGVEAKAGVDAYHQQVERVGERLLDLFPLAVDELAQPQDWKVVAKQGEPGQEQDQKEGVRQEQPEQESEHGAGGSPDQPDHAEVFRRQVGRPSGEIESRLQIRPLPGWGGP